MEQLNNMKEYSWRRPITSETLISGALLIVIFDLVRSFLDGTKMKTPLLIVNSVLLLFCVIAGLYYLRLIIVSGDTSIKLLDNDIAIKHWSFKQRIIPTESIQDIAVSNNNILAAIILKDNKKIILNLKGLEQEKQQELIDSLMNYK
ncbi:MAG: hypothetical protein Q8920_00955 [Bacillota bacterium]|nr:hypothetical protein [Bacillota bacterium]